MQTISWSNELKFVVKGSKEGAIDQSAITEVERVSLQQIMTKNNQKNEEVATLWY